MVVANCYLFVSPAMYNTRDPFINRDCRRLLCLEFYREVEQGAIYIYDPPNETQVKVELIYIYILNILRT